MRDTHIRAKAIKFALHLAVTRRAGADTPICARDVLKDAQVFLGFLQGRRPTRRRRGGATPAPLFEVVAPSGHKFRIWPNGHAEGFPEGSVLINGVAPRLTLTLGLVVRARNGGRISEKEAERILAVWEQGAPIAPAECAPTWADLIEAGQSGLAGRSDAPVQLGPNDAALALDRTVAEVVFGIPPETLDSWPFALPRFSTDRHAAGLALARVSTLPDGQVRLQQALADELDQWLPPGDRSHFAVLTVFTAAAMCRAAVSGARECRAAGSMPAPGNRPVQATPSTATDAFPEPPVETGTGPAASASPEGADSTCR